jgi:hypothetical protein
MGFKGTYIRLKNLLENITFPIENPSSIAFFAMKGLLYSLALHNLNVEHV